MESRIEKINRIAQERTDAMMNEAARRMQDRQNWTDRIKEYGPRVKELLDTAKALVENNMHLGPIERRNNGDRMPKFTTDEICHKFGFDIHDPYYLCMGRGDARSAGIPRSIGTCGGGVCGTSFLVNADGDIVAGTDKEYKDFIRKCTQFVDEFDQFEADFYGWVDSLSE